MKNLKKQVYRPIWESIDHHMLEQVSVQIDDHVYDKVYIHVCYQVKEHIWDMIETNAKS